MGEDMPNRMRYGRNPDAICMMATLCVVLGALTVTGNMPGSIANLVPFWIGLVWSATLSLGAGVTLAGVLWKDPLTGWTLEISGRIAVTLSSIAYFFALAQSITEWGSAVVLSLVLSVGVASAWRVTQLVRKLDEFRTAVNGQPGVRR